MLGDTALDFKKALFNRYMLMIIIEFYYFNCMSLFYCFFSFYSLFSSSLLYVRLRLWYVNWKESFRFEDLTEESKYQFINLSLFYAEVFVRVTKPVSESL